MAAYTPGRVAALYMASRCPVLVAKLCASRIASVAVRLDSVRSRMSARTASGSAWARSGWPGCGLGPVTTCAVLADRPRDMATYRDSRVSDGDANTCAVSTVRPCATYTLPA